MLVLVGPSASGKTQIVQELIKNYNMKKLVTYTTRPMRVGEVDGKDYHFITVDEFKQKIDNNFFIEYVQYNNNYYGTSRSDLSDDKVVILEPTGLKHYIKEARDLITVVVLRCSKNVLGIRMAIRGDKPEDIKRRLDGDGAVFTKEIEGLADLVLDTTPSNIYNDASIIYKYYQFSKGN